jgi:hypothetical protein
MIAKPNDLATLIGGEAALLSESTMGASALILDCSGRPRWLSTLFGTTKLTDLDIPVGPFPRLLIERFGIET